MDVKIRSQSITIHELNHTIDLLKIKLNDKDNHDNSLIIHHNNDLTKYEEMIAQLKSRTVIAELDKLNAIENLHHVTIEKMKEMNT
jgi:hypothetical protein